MGEKKSCQQILPAEPTINNPLDANYHTDYFTVFPNICIAAPMDATGVNLTVRTKIVGSKYN